MVLKRRSGVEVEMFEARAEAEQEKSHQKQTSEETGQENEIRNNETKQTKKNEQTLTKTRDCSITPYSGSNGCYKQSNSTESNSTCIQKEEYQDDVGE
jgi:hypothetical protein